MTTSLSRSFRLCSTLNIEEEAMMITKNQGISSILAAESVCERSIKSSSSLRRTLSADMSSTKWLTQMKNIASSEEFSVSFITDSSSYEREDEEEEEYDEERKGSDDSETEPQSQFDIWSSIQKEVYEKKELEKPGQFDIWSSIISQKEQENNKNKSSLPPAPYIHTLVRRSASSLSEKSLEICTESLGSETGSDGFSYPPSDTETGDGEDDKEMEQEQQQSQERVTEAPNFDFEQLQISKYSYVISKRAPQRSFPPPIPSLSRNDGASIRMQSRRNNGRLVLEAVSVPSANNFRALRQDGRLVLTFINSYSTEPLSKNEQVDELEEEFENLEEEERESEAEEKEIEEEEEKKGEKEVEFAMEQAPKLTSGAVNVHRLTLMGLANRDTRWPKNFNEVVKFNEVMEDHIKPTTIVAQALPSPPRIARLIPKSPATTAAAAANGAYFNAYEYYWRPKPTVGAQNKGKNTTNVEDNNTKKFTLSKNSLENRHDQQQLLVLRGNKGDYLVPLLKSCKEPRRSLLFWEPNCASIV